MSRTDAPALEAVLGCDPSLLAVIERAVRIAPTTASVLLLGETGTGKELFARILHELGPHAPGPYVAVNCGALSSELAESELFGHERGAFTGAASRRIGWFEEADGGTLVLDEVGELPPALQPKLLRVLETGCLRRVGGRGEVPVRTRVVASTLRDLHREAHEGSFRLDLYHRLSGFEIWLPPLRQRPGDILPLARRFLGEMEREVGPRRLTAEAEARLQSYAWPGNVRELRNVIRRSAFLGEEAIDVEALEIEDLGEGLADLEAPGRPDEPDHIPLAGRSYRDMERDIFGELHERAGGRVRLIGDLAVEPVEDLGAVAVRAVTDAQRLLAPCQQVGDDWSTSPTRGSDDLLQPARHLAVHGVEHLALAGIDDRDDDTIGAAVRERQQVERGDADHRQPQRWSASALPVGQADAHPGEQPRPDVDGHQAGRRRGRCRPARR